MKKNQEGFSSFELILALVAFAIVAVIGFVVANNSKIRPNSSKANTHFSQTPYKLPSFEKTFSPTTLPSKDQVESKVVDNTIHIIYTPAQSEKKYQINTTENGLTVVNANGDITKTIMIIIVKNFELGTELNQGLDIGVGNQFSNSDESFGKVADITHGLYSVKVKVYDETGKLLDSISSLVDYK